MRIPCICFPNKECPTSCPQYQGNRQGFISESEEAVKFLSSTGTKITVEQLAEEWFALSDDKATAFAREVVPNRKGNLAGDYCFLNTRSN